MHKCARSFNESCKQTHYDLVGIKSEARGYECMRDLNLRVAHVNGEYGSSAIQKLEALAYLLGVLPPGLRAIAAKCVHC